MITDFNHPTTLKLAVQRGLLGNVSSNLAGVHAKLDGNRIVISAYFFDHPADEDRQYVEEAAAEVIGDFPESYELETRYDLLSSVTLNTIEWKSASLGRSHALAIHQHPVRSWRRRERHLLAHSGLPVKNLCRFALFFLVPLELAIPWRGAAYGQDVRVRIVYSKDGKPAHNQRIVLYEGDPSRASTTQLKKSTSSDGVAVFHITEPPPKTVWVDEDNGQIRGCARQNPIPLEEVVKAGVTIGIDERFGRFCKVDESSLDRLKAKPGEIVLFVRQLTKRDSLREY